MPLLIVGEVYVDFTLGTSQIPPKMRLGGIVHAARGLWAADVPYAVAAVCPEYLVEQAEDFLAAHGCSSFVWLGNVSKAPNVVVIGDVREVGHQGYEDLLREERTVSFREVGESLKAFDKVVVYPGHFDLASLSDLLNRHAEVTIDVAYDVQSFDELEPLKGILKAVVISTSSELFLRDAHDDVSQLRRAAADLNADILLLKENRGGSRIFPLPDGEAVEIPATLSETVNSVGVGDAYTAVFAALAHRGWEEAAYRGAQVATNYASTTFPDDLRAGVRRDLKLSLEVVRSLGGTSIPWHERPNHQIYLAAPDFSYVRGDEIDAAVAALRYHNFRVRRPVQENGEAERVTSASRLKSYYFKDLELLEECSLVFAVPINRDPGTLVEVGFAIARMKPVVMFDARNENANTMTICGSCAFSSDLDECINGVFEAVSQLRRSSRRPS